ncbi:MAG: D-arabinono-1,4-lactone oxidase [Spongiibacteraceae bacterium]
MKRRDFSKAALLAPVAMAAVPVVQAESKGSSSRRSIPWQNWSGSQGSQPSARQTPRTEEELAALLKSGAAPLRPVGAGHSFSPLVPTDGTIISTRRFNKIEKAGELSAHIGAGTKINQLGEALHAMGQAMPNLPDVDEQTMAGAMSTGTHGTGVDFGAMHSYLEGLRLVTPTGQIIDCSRSEHPEIFDAARVSIGSLGVITRYTVRNEKPYKLKRRTWMQPLDEVLEQFHTLAAQNRNFEMYYIPHSDNALVITTNETDEEVQPRGADTDNDSVKQLQQLRDYASWWPGLRRKILTSVSGLTEPEESVDWWWNIYPSDRAVRFNEMEYHLPRENIVEAVRAVRERVEKHHPDVFFPIEVRVIREDDAWLSPFYKRPSASLAVHRFYEEDYKPYFHDIEKIYQPMSGRPHWGKLHTLGAKELSARYPRWNDFQAVRRELDPEGRMLNSHLKQVFADV